MAISGRLQHVLQRAAQRTDHCFLSQVFLLGYVSFIVPLRTCYDIDSPLWSTGFWIDLFVDMFFISDLVLVRQGKPPASIAFCGGDCCSPSGSHMPRI